MKNITKFLLFVFGVMSSISYAQLTCTETFSASGQDDDPTILSINASELTCNGGVAIDALKIVNIQGALASSNCGTNTSTGWYAFELNIDGAITSEVCVSELEDLDVTGFTNITITSSDTDNYSDGITISLDIEVTYTPSCTNPFNSMLADIQTTSADFSWEAGIGANNYSWEVIPSGNSQGTGVVDSGTTSSLSATASGLSPNTDYDFIIISDCESVYASPLSFTTLPLGDSCASAIDLDLETSPLSDSTNGALHNYDQDCLNTTAPDKVYSVTVPDGFILTIGQSSNSYDSVVRIGYGGSCPGDTSIDCYDEPDDKTVEWTNDTGSDQEVYYVQSGYFSGNGAFNLTWAVEPPPSCTNPENIGVDAVQTDGATFSWAAGIGAANYNWEVVPSGNPQGTGVVASGTTASLTATATGLTTNTNYDFLIKSDCESVYAGPITFYTGHCIPTGSSNTSTYINNFSTTGGSTNISNLSSGYATDGYQDNFTTFTVSSYDGGDFDYNIAIVGGTLGCTIWVDWDNNLVFDPSEVEFTTTSYQSGPFSGTITVPPGTALGDYRMRIMVDFNDFNPNDDACSGGSRHEVEDYKVTVTNPPSCTNPEIIVVESVQANTAEFSWDAGIGASSYDWEVVPAGNGQGNGTVASGNTANLTVSANGLSAQTDYDFYVKSDCESAYIGPETFYTGHCIPTGSSNTSTYIDNFSTSGGSTNISNLSSGYAIDGYQDNFTTSTVSSYDGGDFDYDIAIVGGTLGCTIWVDWDNNLVFDPSEVEFTTTSYQSGPFSGTITVPPGTALGDYRMRIMVDFNDPNPDDDACSGGSRHEVEDYKVTVTNPPSCTNPENIIVDNLQPNAAAFSWEAGIGASNYDWEVVPSGNGQGNGVVDSGTTAALMASASGLSPTTEYDFYIKSDCETIYTEPVAFTTLPEPPVNDECSTAISLTVNTDESCTNVTSATILGATDSGIANCSGTEDDDVWFSFVATSEQHTIELLNISNGTSNLNHAVYDAGPGCGSLGSAILCSDPNTSELSGLTVNNTYFIQVYSWTGTSGQTSDFDICVGTPPPPATSNCGSYTSAPDLFVSDASPVTDIISVTDTGLQTISDLNVVLKIDHTYLGDLSITLTSPSGTVVDIFSSNCSSNNDMEVMLDDEGNAIVCGSPTEGIIIPDNPLSSFDGELIIGDWTLDVVDTAGGDDGTLIQWCLVPTLTASSCTATTTWNGSSWDNGIPDSTTAAILEGDYTTGSEGNIDACGIIINPSVTATVSAGTYIKAEGDIVVSGILDVLHEGSLVQVNPTAITANNGSINIQKITPSLATRDFMILGSPMTAETRDGVYGNAVMVREHITSNFSPNPDVAAAFPGANNFADDDGNNFQNYSGTITPGEGYLVRPQNTPTESGSYTLNYSQGTLNSGAIDFNIAFNSDQNSSPNMLGNPYASAIDADLFVTENSALVDVIYFWEHLTAPSTSYPGYNPSNYDMGDISQYNAALGAGVPAANGGSAPNKYIASGQGFAVKAIAGGTATFTNAMRVTDNNNTYGRNTDAELLYLNISNETYGLGSTALVAYTEASTTGFDEGYDNDRLATPVSLYTMCEVPYKRLGIQSRGSFDIEDKFFLGFSSQVMEDQHYKISIGDFSGMNLTDVDVILIDNITNVTTYLKDSNYEFVSRDGDNPERFTVLFRDPSLENQNFAALEISIYPNPADDILNIVSPKAQIQQVEIVDMRGRLVLSELFNGSYSNQLDVSTLDTAVYFVKISAREGTVTKRLIIE